MRRAVSVLVLTLAASAISACSGEDYCTRASDLGKNYANLDFTALSDKEFEALLADLDAVADSAPEDIEPDWRTLREAAVAYGDLVEDSGITFDQLPDVLNGNEVPGVGDTELQKFEDGLDEYRNNAAFPAAGQAISENLKSECGLSS